ncbi:MAG: isoprenylcysteine carboxylmethyltransferase family protein [Candidatus Acidiferrales bacterium]
MAFFLGAAFQILWLVFLVYWIVAARSVNKMRSGESVWQRLSYLLLIVVSLILFISDSRWFGVLNRRFVPQSYEIAILGLLLTAAGIGFAIWARNHIGRFWSGSVAIREDHQLIRSGPYSRIRHPIYTGILVALAGTALAVGTYRAVLAFLLILLSLIYKAHLEEALLTREFGAAFDDHRRHTGFFLPRVS